MSFGAQRPWRSRSQSTASSAVASSVGQGIPQAIRGRPKALFGGRGVRAEQHLGRSPAAQALDVFERDAGVAEPGRERAAQLVEAAAAAAARVVRHAGAVQDAAPGASHVGWVEPRARRGREDVHGRSVARRQAAALLAEHIERRSRQGQPVP